MNQAGPPSGAVLERSLAIRRWFAQLVDAWRAEWAEASETRRQQARMSFCDLRAPVQARVYARASSDVPIAAHAVVLRHAPAEPDGDVRVKVVGADDDVVLDESLEGIALSALERDWTNMAANWSPGRPSDPPPQPWHIYAQRSGSDADAWLWLVPGELTAHDVERWVEFLFRERTSVGAPAPPRDRPTASGRRFIYEAGQDRERLAITRWLSTTGADQLLAALGITGPAWCLLNASRSDVFGPGYDGDVDLLAGPLELDISTDEWDELVRSEAALWPLSTHRGRILQTALARACADGRVIWPPSMATIVGCEAKASWFEPEAELLKRTHAGQTSGVKGQLRVLTEHGIDRVAFLHLLTTKPRDTTDINPWFQASIDAENAESALDDLEPLFTEVDLPGCGYFRTVVGAVRVDTEERSGAGGMLTTILPASANPSSATASREWRQRFCERLAACERPRAPRVFITCCARCKRWNSSWLIGEGCRCGAP